MVIKPVKNGIITSTFEDHKKRSPKGSWGIDIGSIEKDPIDVFFSYDGIIYSLGWSGTFGNRIWIKLTSGLYIGNYNIYPHLASFNNTLKEGAKVKQGDLAGILGNTGVIMVNGSLVTNKGQIKSPTGRHLHFEIRTKPDTTGISINPEEITKLYSNVG